jgi:hypothetical protein
MPTPLVSSAGGRWVLQAATKGSEHSQKSTYLGFRKCQYLHWKESRIAKAVFPLRNELKDISL